MIRLLTFVSVVVLGVAAYPVVQGLTDSGATADFFALRNVQPGMKGRGRTVFRGTKVEEFGVEVLGVLKNIAPGQNLILVRLDGGPLKESGVYAGMSGSPVYIDGKIVGALSYSLPFSKEPIAGITPIEEMVNIFEEKPTEKTPPKFTLSKLSTNDSLIFPKTQVNGFKISDAELGPDPSAFGFKLSGQTLMPIGTPLSLSGFSPLAIDLFGSKLQALGLTPVTGAAVAQPSSEANREPSLEPGSNINVELVRGDLQISASGTSTYIKGDKMYAFGHPFLSVGFTELPLNMGQVLAILPNMVVSAAVSASVRPIGIISQDRATGILGVLGKQPRMIPVTLNLHTSRNVDKSYKYEVISDRLLTPLLMNLTVFSTIVSSERALGESTLQVKGKIRIKNHPEVTIEDIFSAKINSPLSASRSVAYPIYFLLAGGFENLEMESVSLDISSSEVERDVILDRIWYDKSKISNGENLNITAFFKRENGDEWTVTYPVKIPDEIPPGPISILVSDGDSLTAMDAREMPGNFIPENLNQLIKAINNLKKNNRLYIRLFRRNRGGIIKGEGLPGLPPSILSILDSKKSSGGMYPIHTSTYIEYGLPPTEFVISGQKTIEVEVVPK